MRDLLKGVRARVFPVGRLDYHSAGLLLLTNDGELALRLTHPRYGIRKTYQVKVKGDPQPSQLATLAGGVRLADGTTNPAEVRILRQRAHKTWLSITLAEGKNRQVRRMCEAVGLPVEKLVRVAFGGLRLGALPPGHWRHLDPGEVEQLRRPAPPPRPARPPRGRQRPPVRRDDAGDASAPARPPARGAHGQRRQGRPAAAPAPRPRRPMREDRGAAAPSRQRRASPSVPPGRDDEHPRGAGGPRRGTASPRAGGRPRPRAR